jgi:hypothetical protein
MTTETEAVEFLNLLKQVCPVGERVILRRDTEDAWYFAKPPVSKDPTPMTDLA